jgi:hypothetical protein
MGSAENVVDFAGAALVGCWDFIGFVVFFIVHAFVHAYLAALCYPS